MCDAVLMAVLKALSACLFHSGLEPTHCSDGLLHLTAQLRQLPASMRVRRYEDEKVFKESKNLLSVGVCCSQSFNFFSVSFLQAVEVHFVLPLHVSYCRPEVRSVSALY